jgi:quercetin dioxygenase-like cupin family protein
VKSKDLPGFRDAETDLLGELRASDLLALEQGLHSVAEDLPRAHHLRGAQRLQQAVTRLPLRYAPFFSKLTELWQMPTVQVVSELSRARDPKSWRRSALPGLKTFEIRLDDSSLGHARLLRFAAGSRFPRHDHHGPERVLVLEGSFADGDGREVHAGESQTMLPGSAHELTILGGVPCVTAIVENGIRFTGPWLRWLDTLMRRRACP